MRQIQSMIILMAIFLMQSCGSGGEQSAEEIQAEREKVINIKAAKNTSGSGYRELEGKFLAYEYVDFGGFKLAFHDNKIKWRGDGGYFDNVVAEVEPQISKVSEDVYFLSWVFPQGGGDNVVVNLKDKTVFAHLYYTDESLENSDFHMIHGQVLCKPSVNCEFPAGKLSSMLSIMKLLKTNTTKFEMPSMYQVERPMTQADISAREELAGKIIQYTNDSAQRSILVNQGTTSVRISDGDAKNYITHATKIADGIYFISWLGDENYGDHIVFNQNTMEIFDHVIIDEVRQEEIYRVRCFSSDADCN